MQSTSIKRVISPSSFKINQWLLLFVIVVDLWDAEDFISLFVYCDHFNIYQVKRLNTFKEEGSEMIKVYKL